MNPLEQARNTIKYFLFPEDFKDIGDTDSPRLMYYNGTHTVMSDEPLTADVISECLTYSVKVDKRRVSDENKIALGASKYMGLPHLPDEFNWPEGYCFLAQINLSEFNSYDLGDILPSSGLLFFFFMPGYADEGMVFYYDGSIDKLKIRSYPENMADTAYFTEDIYSINYSPQYSFFIDAGWGGKDFYVLPELKKELDSILKCPMNNNNVKTPSIFSRPIFYQSEDQAWYPIDYKDEFTSSIMVLQDDIDDYNFHFWVDKQSIQDKSFKNYRFTVSGT